MAVNFFWLFLLILSLGFLSPQKILAVSVSPSPIGDINIREAKEITITGLDPSTNYFWNIQKQTSAIPIGFTDLIKNCFNSNDSGELKQNIGPFSAPGSYKLILFKTDNSGQCNRQIAAGATLVDADFDVGGKTDVNCCNNALIPVYDRNKDVCKKDVDIPVLSFFIPNTIVDTTCKSQSTFCEPDTLKCFKNKTLVVNGKICKDPNNKADPFDPSRDAICGFGGGDPCGDPTNPGFKTAIGCIHTSPVSLARDVLTFVVAISGGLAFLMMLLGVFQMLTSQGNPDSLNAGRERLTSAVIGLLFVIFSVLLLRIIGVDILGLGKFFGGP